MNILNARINNKIQNIRIENGKILAVGDASLKEGYDAKGMHVIPGLIDLHTHGGNGLNVMDGSFQALCDYYAKCGTTSFLATTMTAPLNTLQELTAKCTDYPGAHLLGFHLEGPFINPKYKGAMYESWIVPADYRAYKKCKNVKRITLAPEYPENMQFIEKVSKKVLVSIGHTDADFDTACRAFDSGAALLTHTYNAMPAFDKRAPGPIGACIEKDKYAEFICDGFHVQKPVLLAGYRTFGPEHFIMISDSIEFAGCPDGIYPIPGNRNVVIKNQEVRLESGTIYGCYKCLLDGFRNMLSFGIPLKDCIRMASENPARLLKVKKGKIKAGYDADLLVLDDSFQLKATFISGELYHEN